MFSEPRSRLPFLSFLLRPVTNYYLLPELDANATTPNQPLWLLTPINKTSRHAKDGLRSSHPVPPKYATATAFPTNPFGSLGSAVCSPSGAQSAAPTESGFHVFSP